MSAIFWDGNFDDIRVCTKDDPFRNFISSSVVLYRQRATATKHVGQKFTASTNQRPDQRLHRQTTGEYYHLFVTLCYSDLFLIESLVILMPLHGDGVLSTDFLCFSLHRIDIS